MSTDAASVEDVLDFWFADARAGGAALTARNKLWFGGDTAFDSIIRERFSVTLAGAVAGALKRWKLTPQGTLALIIVFDQFPRNIHRGLPAAFACDQRALALCRDAIVMGADRDLDIVERLFFYLPLEHAEDLEAQEKSVACFAALHAQSAADLRTATAVALEHAIAHRDLIARFGRFPHRNLTLDRVSTAAENAWLSEHPATYGQG